MLDVKGRRPLPSEKKSAPKKRARGQIPQRVRIPFRPMRAPFGGPKKFDDTKNTATLTLSFPHHEYKSPEIQTLRAVLTQAEEVLSQLIEFLEPTCQIQDPISCTHKNTFIRPGKAVSEDGDEHWPDTIP